MRPVPLGPARPAAFAGAALLVGLALGVPVGSIVYLIVQGGTTTLPPASLAIATASTFGYAAAAGLVATVAALPVALLSVRFPRRRVMALERSNMVILAVPGLVVALSFTYLTEHFLQGRFYQTSPLLVLVYTIMFFPLAVVAVRPPWPGRRSGWRRWRARWVCERRSVLWRVTLPLVAPGLAAAFALVFFGDRDRAHRDPRPPPHERRDVGDPVLGLPVQRVLQPGGGVRRGHGAHRRRARVRARALVRPPTRPGGRRRCGGSGHRGRGPVGTQGVAAA